GAVPSVAAAAPGFVVLEEAVRDRGHSDIEQTTAVTGTEVAVAAAAGIVGTPDGLIAREETSGNQQDPLIGIHNTTADGRSGEVAAGIVGTPGGLVANERTILDGEGAVAVIDTAAAAEAVSGKAISPDGLVADEGAVGDGGRPASSDGSAIID